MKKILLSITVLALAISANGQLTDPSPYCGSDFNNNYNMFENIVIKGVVLSFGPQGNWGTPNTYLYFNTTTFPDFTQGANADIDLNVFSVSDMEPIYFALWIDYDQNDTFDVEELVMQNSNTTMAALSTFGAPVSTISKLFTVPPTATLGTTRARLIRGSNTGDPFGPYDANFVLDPCNDVVNGSFYGCTYDFDINIIPGTFSIENQSLEDVIKIYPNPTSDKLFIDLENNNILDLSISDVLGNNIQIKLENGSIDLSDFKPGMYILNVLTKGNARLTKKIIVE